MIEVPFLSYPDLKQRAEEVLAQSSYHDVFPVEVELIVEKDFRIDIIPIVGLHHGFGIDAFISKNLREIRVDEYVLDNFEARYRFTLAHELGHHVLHPEIIASIPFTSISEWKDCMANFPEKQYGFLEYQANTFANALLVPQAELESRFFAMVDRIRQGGLEPKEYPDECMETISTELGKQFRVSRMTMLIRLEKENLFDRL